MDCKIGKIFLISFVAVLLVVKPSASSPLRIELLEALTNRLDSLQVKVDLLEAKNTENEAKIREQDKEIVKQKTKIDAIQLEHQFCAPSSEPLANNGEHFPAQPTSIENKMAVQINNPSSGDSSTKAVAPSSCRELSLIGHSLDGLYLLQNLNTKKIETVFCDFGESISQKWIGNIDVKTKSVHFYVQRNTEYSIVKSVIPFELARLNEGGAMNLDTGIFTVPVPGIYHFEFSGIKEYYSTNLNVFLQVNGENVGNAYTQPSTTGNLESLSLSVSLRLKANDEVNLYNYGSGVLFDDSNHNTHFAGWLVEEDLFGILG